MILDAVMRRKMRVLCMEDTLAVAARKMRDMDRVNSPLVYSFEEQESYEMVHLPQSDVEQSLRCDNLETDQALEPALMQPE